ncbi:MAG: citrate transporter [Eubacterium sp.]|jgi:Na+/H+ antiporter NhaD/arsenite permease-like protein|nr:citrate transporter [Eubacterium sp.]
MLLAQILATAIFVVMFLMIVLDKIERHYVTIGCGVLTLIAVFGIVMHSPDAIIETLNIRSIFTLEFWYAASESSESSSGINWATIFFIAGMMVMVEGMAKAGFFQWLCMRLAKMVNYKPVPLFVAFMIMSAFLAMFIDSITVILFLAAVTVELAKLLKFSPVPMILSEIFCANLGGSATMCGDPPNIIIGTSLGYSFSDFLTNTGLMAAVSLVLVVIYFFFVFHKELEEAERHAVDTSSMPDPKEAITNKKDFTVSCLIFGCAVVMLVTHAQTGLTVAFIGAVITVITLAAYAKYALELLSKVDYKTLLFFIGLFMVVGGLEQTGILEIIAGYISQASKGNFKLMIAIIIWVSAVASAFVDNIPFAATMIPVIKSLAATQGVDLETLAWALSMGTDIGGSGTPIGASANVVGTSVAAKNGYVIGWGEYCKSAAPATIIVVSVSMVIIFIRYC